MRATTYQTAAPPKTAVLFMRYTHPTANAGDTELITTPERPRLRRACAVFVASVDKTVDSLEQLLPSNLFQYNTKTNISLYRYIIRETPAVAPSNLDEYLNNSVHVPLHYTPVHCNNVLRVVAKNASVSGTGTADLNIDVRFSWRRRG